MIDTKTEVVAFCGVAGSGKSTAADALLEKGFVRVKFADVLKDMLRTFYRSAGLPDIKIEAKIEGHRKELPDPLLCGKTPRYAMQKLGTEWGRVLIGDDFWVNAWKARAALIVGDDDRVVCDDVRFANEVRAVHDLGGVVVKMEGRGGIPGDHVSEKLDVEPDLTLSNTDSILDLKRRVQTTFGANTNFC